MISGYSALQISLYIQSILLCCRFFLFLKVRITSCILTTPRDAQPPFHPTPLFCPAVGAAAWLHRGAQLLSRGRAKPLSSCSLLPHCCAPSKEWGEAAQRLFSRLFIYFFLFFSLQDMSLQFEQGLCRQSGSLQMIIKGDVLTVNIALLLGLSACPPSAHLLLITLRQTYLGPVVQVLLSYVCHSTLFLAKMNAAKCI